MIEDRTMRTSSHQSWHPEGRVEQYEESYFVIEEVYGAIRDAFLSKWEPRPHYYYDLEYILVVTKMSQCCSKHHQYFVACCKVNGMVDKIKK